MDAKTRLHKVIAKRVGRDALQRLYEECAASMRLVDSLKQANAEFDPHAAAAAERERLAVVRQLARQRYAAELQLELDRHVQEDVLPAAPVKETPP
jgi:hypothetical protein